MSKFNTYIRQINDIAAEAFKEYTAAQDAYKSAESKKNAYPRKIGLGADYTAKSAAYLALFASYSMPKPLRRGNAFFLLSALL